MTDTSTSPVSLDDERLIRDGEAAVEEYGRSTSRARDQIMPMARGLLAARRRYSADQDFGRWLEHSPYDRVVGHTDRAALIKIGEYEHFIVRLIKTTTLISPRAIWDAYGDAVEAMAVSRPGKPVETGKPAEIPQEVVPMAPPEQTATPLPARTSVPAISKRNPFYGRERADEVRAIYQDSNTRSNVGKLVSRSGNDLWAMILTAIDAGFLTQTIYGSHARPSLRILFPHDGAANYCRDIDLSTPKARKRVRDVILPAMIANKDAILANPSQIGQLMNRAEWDAQKKANEAAATKRLVERRAAMPTHQYEVVMYGEQFWPNPKPEVCDYTYDQCRAACWYFYETDQLYKVTTGGGNDTKGRAMLMRFSVRWFSQYADREMIGAERDKIKMVFRLVHAMAHAMEQNPSGASKRPPSPTNDGEWPDKPA